ncbi:hypothetical protein [Sandaracinus amylolyticus]|uniref:Uncharacterized protein n=1 Tax=Sandaracinus amylolyticus TaxID=927083 RepID=A0A0F6SEU3_9BACT|nr:hypothetical protein [Sandaracinus amylolyticus]AKF05794.1 hypothetical protein DB32_002943 [Sandaracinus amylolyticus]
MRFVLKAALRPVPRHAVVDEVAISGVEEQLGEEGEELQEMLDATYREMDRKQPALATWLGEQVSSRTDDLAQSLGYFLVVTVYMAFREAFPTRLTEVDETSLKLAIDTLAADEELRANDPAEVMESDDVVAMGQPVLLHFVQHHLEQALSQAGEDPDLEAFDHIYRAVLVEVIALSHAVKSPDGTAPQDEILA